MRAFVTLVLTLSLLNLSGSVQLNQSVASETSVSKISEGEEAPSTLMLNISMFAVALAIPVVFSECRERISSMIFLGAGAYLIAMEIFNHEEHKKLAERDQTINSQYSVEKQIEAAEAAANLSENAAEAGKKRSKNFLIASLGFAAASAAAVIEAAMETPAPMGACTETTQEGSASNGGGRHFPRLQS